jgi:hypothetical protein
MEMERWIGVRGFPPMRQKKDAWMGHGAIMYQLSIHGTFPFA